MTISKRYFRYVRYRAVGCLQGCFTFSNLVFVAFTVAMVFIVLVLQKLEDPNAVSFLASGPFLPATKRREIVVTTARNPLTKEPDTVCEKLEAEIAKMAKAFRNDKPVRGSGNSKTGKKLIRYQPAIRSFPTDKTMQGALNATAITALKKFTSADAYNLDKDSGKFQAMFRKKAAESAEIILREKRTTSTVIKMDKWLRVNKDIRNKVLVFSAYWDDRIGSPTIRIMAIMPTKKSPAIYCRLKMTDGKCYDITAIKKAMNEHWRLKYASFLLSCPLYKGHTQPTHVTVSTDADYVDSVILPIHYNKNDTVSPRGHIAVCVKPFHYNYDRATWLVEFLELHRMLGVDHFVFYNHTVGENVEKVLRSYMDVHVVSVLPWEIGIMSQKEIRTEAIFSSLNDCLFRTMFLFNYAIMLDFDEYIIPRDHDTYSDMIEKIEKDNKQIRGRPGSFVFRNTFFYLYWANDTTAFGVQPEKPPSFIPYLVTQYKTRRLHSSMKPGSRSKYIVIPDRAIEVGNHVVWKHTPGSRSISVPERTALLHHYRICEFGGFNCLKKTSAVDQTAIRFGPELLDRVRYQCELAFKSDGKCPVSPPLGSPY